MKNKLAIYLHDIYSFNLIDKSNVLITALFSFILIENIMVHGVIEHDSLSLPFIFFDTDRKNYRVKRPLTTQKNDSFKKPQAVLFPTVQQIFLKMNITLQ